MDLRAVCLVRAIAKECLEWWAERGVEGGGWRQRRCGRYEAEVGGFICGRATRRGARDELVYSRSTRLARAHLRASLGYKPAPYKGGPPRLFRAPTRLRHICAHHLKHLSVFTSPNNSQTQTCLAVERAERVSERLLFVCGPLLR